MEDFLFPASKVVVQTRKNKAETPLDPVVPVCASSASVNAAFELLVALCVNCVANMKLVVDTLREMYYSGRCYSNGIFKIKYRLRHHMLPSKAEIVRHMHHLFLYFLVESDNIILLNDIPSIGEVPLHFRLK